MKKKIIFATGGTGGHVFPAIATAQVLKNRGYTCEFFTDTRGVKYLENSGFDFTAHAGATPQAGGILKRLQAMFTLLWAAARCMWAFLKNRPAIVVGFGGYPAFPACLGAYMLKIPLILHEQNAGLSRVNRLFSSYARLIATSFATTARVKSEVKIVPTGNPLRPEFKNLKPKPSKKFHVLILGGSQGASFFSSLIPASIQKLPTPYQKKMHITHQVRTEDLASVKTAYAQTKVTTTLAPFFKDVHKHYESASLLIARAGASTLAEAYAAQVPAIYIPLSLSHNTDQILNARAATTAGCAQFFLKDELDANTLSQTLMQLMDNPKILKTMREKAHELSLPDADERLADLIERTLSS